MKSDLKELEGLESEIEALQEKSNLFKRNQETLKEFWNSRQNFSKELNDAKQSDLLLEDKKSQLKLNMKWDADLWR